MLIDDLGAPKIIQPESQESGRVAIGTMPSSAPERMFGVEIIRLNPNIRDRPRIPDPSK
jgi:hypothetical protein